MSSKILLIVFSTYSLLLLGSCSSRTVTQNKEKTAEAVNENAAVQFQNKGTFKLGSSIYCSNNFAGARLNEVGLINDSSIFVVIEPENTPINISPWYAFKLWSDREQTITVNITYPHGFYHRYTPILSRDGIDWSDADTTVHKVTVDDEKRPISGSLRVKVGRDTLWVAAQELVATPQVKSWTDHLATRPYVRSSTIGKSLGGRPIHSLEIGDGKSKNMLLVISRQHPPEITGFKAMQAFVETISSNSETARLFRQKYTTHVIPVVNPDGVDNGHWRHNINGVDLNRDWSDFKQPETSVVRDFASRKINQEGSKLVFFIDFHSTWKDVYYIPYNREEGESSELVYRMIERSEQDLQGYSPDVAKSLSANKNSVVTSDGYFYKTYGAPSINYEVGDTTARGFIRDKAEVSATKLMELLLEEPL